jgi:hypothetical protein
MIPFRIPFESRDHPFLVKNPVGFIHPSSLSKSRASGVGLARFVPRWGAVGSAGSALKMGISMGGSPSWLI